MPVVQFTSVTDLEGQLQAALIESVEAIRDEMANGGSSPMFTDEDDMFSGVCLDYSAAITHARSGWFVSEEVPLWWTEVVTGESERLQEADAFLGQTHLRYGMTCAFYGQDGAGSLVRRIVLLSEDKLLSAKFRTLFDH